MQSVKNPNLLKLWLSFFCLSLANALASDSVGKIHAVHVNEVIRIEVIQTQRFSWWNICAGSLMDICQSNYYTHSKGWEGPAQSAVIAKTQRWCWTSPLHLRSDSSHTSHPDFREGNFSHRGPDSARYLRTTSCWNPTYLLLRLHPGSTLTYHRSWTRGTACLLHCSLRRMWSSQESEVLLTGMKATSFCGTCTHITTRFKV